MTKQRRTFFVDDILHMVMPNETKELKRKRSISSEKIEHNDQQISKKKIRYEQSEYTQVIDIMNDHENDDDDDDQSTISNDSNNLDDSSGEIKYNCILN